MAYNTKAMKTDVNAKPIPQYYNPVTDEYEVVQGTGGAARQVLYAPDGQPISVADNKLAVRAEELEEKLEAVRVLLNTLAGEDFATQTTLAQILAKLDGVIDGTTEGKLAVRATELEEKLEAVRVLLNTLAGEDFATQTTLAQILEKMIANPATEAKQDSLATLVGAIEDKLDGVIDGTTPATTQLTGSKVGVMQSPPVVGERTVTSTAAQMHAGTSPLAGRYEMVVLNTSANTVYWGSAGVTLETGFPLLPNDSVHFKFHPETHTAIYFIADGNFVVKVVELS
jgi:Arc/MetJ family transcription regulator